MAITCCIMPRHRRKRVLSRIFAVVLVYGWLLLQWRDVGIRCVSNSTRGVDPSAYHANTHIPLIYFITPTGIRTEQKADLTRLSHTLRLVPRLHWIVVEDRPTTGAIVKNLLEKCKVPYTHLAVQTRETSLAKVKHRPPRGVDQRNAALEWITKHVELPSIIYLGDDDNTYDLQLFEEMRHTKKVAVWPVGLAGNAVFQSPVVKDGKVIDWVTGWGTARKFPIDMAGFAINTELLMRPDPPRFNKTVKSGYLESNFLEQLNITLGVLEPKADNCTKVLVWHTRTEVTPLNGNLRFIRQIKKHKLPILEV